ncbi:MAG: CDP-alcohol phosphatidyltransferase family protein [Clostridia bacterium]|nr:CDP-alcohol phosphatidyltransferase family protein [Clostridia bacterium]
MEKIRHERNVNIPNALTLMRILLLPVYAWRYLADDIPGALAVCAAVCISDMLDGLIARRFNQITTLGKLVDPLADKLLLLTALICFGIRGRLEWWVIALVLGKEALMVAGGVYALRKKIVVGALWIGKVATGLFALAVLGKLINHRWPITALGTTANVLLYTAVGITFVALAVYIRNLRRVMKGTDSSPKNSSEI